MTESAGPSVRSSSMTRPRSVAVAVAVAVALAVAVPVRVPVALAVAVAAPPRAAAEEADGDYRWLPASHGLDGVGERIPTPPGFTRDEVEDDSFAAWLRRLPLKPGRPEVRLHDGRRKGNQEAHAAVFEIDVGERDLQQCADATMRLRAEYLFARGREDEIAFDFTSGDEASYVRYRDGWRCSVDGNQVRWHQSAQPDPGYETFRRYMDLVFTYAGTHSLQKELTPVAAAAEVRPGDVFIQGGFPGHAVIVVDVARNAESGEVAFLLAQSYMPAQEIHLLRNPGAALSPWYVAEAGQNLITPEWTFAWSDLRRW